MVLWYKIFLGRGGGDDASTDFLSITIGRRVHGQGESLKGSNNHSFFLPRHPILSDAKGAEGRCTSILIFSFLRLFSSSYIILFDNYLITSLLQGGKLKHGCSVQSVSEKFNLFTCMQSRLLGRMLTCVWIEFS